MLDHTKPTIFKGINKFGMYSSHLYLVFLVTSGYLHNTAISITHVYLQETQLKINTLLETTDTGMCSNNYIYVPIYVCTYS